MSDESQKNDDQNPAVGATEADSSQEAPVSDDESSVTSESDPSDQRDALKGISAVSGDKKRHVQSKLLQWGILGCVVLIVVLMMFWPHHAHRAKAVGHAISPESDNVNSELAANLAQLEQASHHVKKQFAQAIQNIRRPAYSRQMLARMNAPANLYTASQIPSTTADESTHSNGNVFAGQSLNDKFANQASVTPVVSAEKILHPKYTIASGEMMHAVLLTAINSDLPGMVTAIISKPVYAYVGQKPLIPAGSRLVGQYSNGILQGQDRVMVIWNRVILPGGTTVQINSPGTDRLGRAGMGANEVNTHFIARFGEASLLSLIGAGTATVGVSGGDGNNSAAQYRSSMAQAFQQSANNALQGTLPTKPTLHVYQGTAINVFVARDLSFYHVLQTTIDN